jgi:hypothetical protein
MHHFKFYQKHIETLVLETWTHLPLAVLARSSLQSQVSLPSFDVENSGQTVQMGD